MGFGKNAVVGVVTAIAIPLLVGIMGSLNFDILTNAFFTISGFGLSIASIIAAGLGVAGGEWVAKQLKVR